MCFVAEEDDWDSTHWYWHGLALPGVAIDEICGGVVEERGRASPFPRRLVALFRFHWPSSVWRCPLRLRLLGARLDGIRTLGSTERSGNRGCSTATIVGKPCQLGSVAR